MLLLSLRSLPCHRSTFVVSLPTPQPYSPPAPTALPFPLAPPAACRPDQSAQSSCPLRLPISVYLENPTARDLFVSVAPPSWLIERLRGHFQPQLPSCRLRVQRTPPRSCVRSILRPRTTRYQRSVLPSVLSPPALPMPSTPGSPQTGSAQNRYA